MANDEWRTPEWVWKPYAPFDLDAAATAENTLAPEFLTKKDDALTNGLIKVRWGSKIWCNPPYSRAAGPLSEWVEAFFRWQRWGYHVVALLPADTSTQWFHRLWRVQPPSAWITFLEKRVRHIDPLTGKPGGSPKFGSLIVEFIP